MKNFLIFILLLSFLIFVLDFSFRLAQNNLFGRQVVAGALKVKNFPNAVGICKKLTEEGCIKSEICYPLYSNNGSTDGNIRLPQTSKFEGCNPMTPDEVQARNQEKSECANSKYAKWTVTIENPKGYCLK